MTWVIGAATTFGYGVVLSDTCVTYELEGQKKTVDAVQKAFLLGPSIVGGFAGSIMIGFQMMDSLRKFLKIPEEDGDCVWDPSWVAQNWCQMAKEVFAKAPKKAQEAHSHIILAGAHPIEDVGPAGFARIYIIVLKSPDFIPRVVQGQFLTIEGIGSGVEVYEKKVKKILETPYEMAKMEVGFPGGMGSILSNRITQHLIQHSATGISPHMHVFIIRRTTYSERANNFTEFRKDGTKVEFKMPTVAKNYEGLLKVLGLQEGTAVLIA